MKKIRLKNGIGFLLLFAALMIALCPAALAAQSISEKTSEDDWENRLLAMLAEHGADPETIGAGYYNLVTGEEHLFNPDSYRISGSMYKVPLNMLMLDWISEGLLDEDETVYGRRYQDLLEGTVIHSNNDDAQTLWTWIGDHSPELPGTVYHRYRILIAPYMGEDPDTVDGKFYENNFFTPRQMLTCMKQLYEGGLRYERLVKAMRKAEPEKYFCQREKRFEIAHKYGWFAEGDILYMNDCAICYTEDPIAIVLFTSGTNEPYGVMADFCTLMCDYAQERYAQRKEEELAAQRTPEPEETPATEQQKQELEIPEPDPTPSPEMLPNTTEDPSVRRSSLGPIVALSLSAVLFLLAMALLVHQKRKQGLRLFYGLLTLLFTGGALVLCFLAGEENLTFIRSAEESPQEVAVRFLESLKNGDREGADACLPRGYQLGLQAPPEAESRAAFLRALEQSWDYRLFGECSVEGDRAWQQLQLTTLSFPLMEEDLQTQLREELAELGRSRPEKELYDEDGNWLREVAGEAWELALLRLTEHPQDYLASVGVQMELHLTGDGWKVVPNRALLSVLGGQLP